MTYFIVITVVSVAIFTVMAYMSGHDDGYKKGEAEGRLRYGEGYTEGWDAAMAVRSLDEYYENLTEEWSDSENVITLPLSPDDQTDVDEKGDVFRDWYNEELETLDARDREYINVKGQAGVDIYNAEKERYK